jgi:hypothetical protein
VPIARRAAHHVLYAESKLQGYAGNFDVPELKHIAPRIWDIYMQYKIMNAQKQKDDENGGELETAIVKRWKFHAFKLLSFIKRDKACYCKF